MTKFITTLYLFASFFLISCKKESKTNSLVLDIDAVIQTTDSINVYYTTNRSIEFNDLQSFWTKVIGNKKNQNVQIIFPDTILPKQIRIDFGRNVSQKDIVLNKIDFAYKNKSFSVKGEEIYFLFRVDESNTVIDKLVGSLKRKEPNQATGPSLYPKGDKLYNKLSQLYTEK